MNLLTDSIFTIGQAAQIAGISDKSLRNWLDKGQMRITHDNEREEGGWRRLSLVEIFQISAIARLIKYGFGVSWSSEVLRDAVQAQMRSLSERGSDDISDLKPFIGLRIFARHTAGGGCVPWTARGTEVSRETALVEDFVQVDFANVIIDCWERLREVLKSGSLERAGIRDAVDDDIRRILAEVDN